MTDKNMTAGPKKFGNWKSLTPEDMGMSPYTLKLDAIRKKPHLPAFVEKLIDHIEEHDHITIGEWLQELSHLDFLAVQIAIRAMVKYQGLLTEDDEKLYLSDIVVILLELLGVAEGLEVPNDIETKMDRFYLFRQYIDLEALKRRGEPIKLYYEHMTLDYDTENPESNPKIVRFLSAD